MKENGRISVESGSNKHPSAKAVKNTVVEMKGLTETTKTTKYRYRKVKGQWVPIAKDGIAYKRSDDIQDGVVEFSPADYGSDEEEALTGVERHTFQMLEDGLLDEFDEDDSSPFIG